MPLFLAVLLGLLNGCLKMPEQKDGIMLAEDGKAFSRIIISKKAPGALRFAAEELQAYLKKTTGADFPIVNEPGPKPNIYLGDNETARQQGLSVKTLKRDGFHRAILDGDIYILGRDNPRPNWSPKKYLLEHGTLNGVYDFLEKACGVRWYFPGPLGEVVSSKRVLETRFTSIKDEPHFVDRSDYPLGFGFGKHIMPDGNDYGGKGASLLWCVRQRLSSYNPVTGCHAATYLHYGQRFGKEHPEWFAMRKNGIRDNNGLSNFHMCWSSGEWIEEVIKDARAFFLGEPASSRGLKHWPGTCKTYDDGKKAFLLDTADGYPGCWCPKCQEAIKKAGSKSQGYSEIQYAAIAKVAEATKDIPNTFISTLAYHHRVNIPETVALPSNLRIRLAVNGRNSVCNPESYQKQLATIRDWSKKTGGSVCLWTYEGPCVTMSYRPEGHGIVSTAPHLTARFFKDVKQDITGVFSEYESLYQTHRALDRYVQYRLLWNPDQDIEKLMGEYFSDLYGPAAGPVADFYKQLEELFKKFLLLKERTLLTVWGKTVTPMVMDSLNQSLAAAEKQSGGEGPYADRVRLLRKYIYDVMVSYRAKASENIGLAAATRAMAFRTEKPGEKAEFPLEKTWESVNWSMSFTQGQMVDHGKKYDKPVRTRFKTLWDDRNLYLLVDCEEPLLKDSFSTGLQKEENTDIWKENEIEVFMDLSTEVFGRYIQIIVNDRGVVADAQKRMDGGLDWKWDSMAKASVTHPENGWRVMISIPFDSLGIDVTRKPFTTAFNIGRHRKIKGYGYELYSWSPVVTRDFHKKTVWGNIELREEKTGANLVKSGDFEKEAASKDLPSGWSYDRKKTKGHIFADDQNALSGKYSLCIDHATNVQFSQVACYSARLEPETEYLVSCMVKGEKIVAGNSGSGMYIGFCPNTVHMDTLKFYPPKGLTGTFDWRPVEMIVRTPAWDDNEKRSVGIVYLRLKWTSGKAWFDEFTVRKLEK